MQDVSMQISYTQVEASATKLKNCKTKMKEILDAVDAEMAKMGRAWQSGAATELTSKYNKLKVKFKSFYTTVENYGKFLDSTVKAYKDADNKLKSVIQENLKN